MNDLASPRSARFRKEREQEWLELDSMVGRALKRGVSVLGQDELERLPALYRAAVSSLAVARKTAMDRALVAYLDALTARAYLAVYGSRRPERTPLLRFFLEQFPQRVRGMLPEVGLSAAVLVLGTLVAYVLVRSDSDWFFAFISAELAGDRVPGAGRETLRHVLYDDGEGLSAFASFLFTHNAGIGLTAFALGFAAGIPTALLVFINGLMLGAFIALYAENGLLVPVLGWLLPHGIPEISAVVLCGAAGFHVGKCLLVPGEMTVRDALVAAGRRAATVIAGSIVLFAIAGIIEGIFRQTVRHDGARFALAAFNLVWLLAWIALPGRGARRGTT